MKRVSIGSLTFSKVICGSNPFYGHSHFSEARNAEYLARFDDDAVKRTIQKCIGLGVNTVESCANERIASLLSELRATNGEGVHFVGSTRIDETSEMSTHQEKLSFLIENRADICVVHAQYVDQPREADLIEGLEPFIDQIHEAGLLAGISTHQISTVELCERKGYGIDAYLFPLNLSGYVYPAYQGKETAQERADLVCSVPKPFVIIKALAAGRIPPDEGLQFVAENSKPNDLVSIGLATEEEVAETIELACKYF